MDSWAKKGGYEKVVSLLYSLDSKIHILRSSRTGKYTKVRIFIQLTGHSSSGCGEQSRKCSFEVTTYIIYSTAHNVSQWWPRAGSLASWTAEGRTVHCHGSRLPAAPPLPALCCQGFSVTEVFILLHKSAQDILISHIPELKKYKGLNRSELNNVEH